MKQSEKDAVASLLDFEDDRREQGLSRSALRDIRRFDSSGQINRWDREMGSNEFIKKLSINDFQLTHPQRGQSVSSAQSLPRRGASAGYRTPPPQLFRNIRPKVNMGGSRSILFDLTKPQRLEKALQIRKASITRRTRNSIVFPISMPSQQLTREVPEDFAEQSKSKLYLKKQSEYKALLRRIQLRPSTERNYDRERSMEIFKKTNALIPSFVPHCFRNIRMIQHKQSVLRSPRY